MKTSIIFFLFALISSPLVFAEAVQTYSYPSQDAPVFAIDFPADWDMTTNTEGAYVESPDKLVAMNVLLIDQSELDVAIEKLKQETGSKFESITWNEGQEPNTVTDDALELTATFNNGLAEASGVKYTVNFVQYVKKNGKKFFLLITQAPIKALDTHADAIEKIVRSIKAQ